MRAASEGLPLLARARGAATDCRILSLRARLRGLLGSVELVFLGLGFGGDIARRLFGLARLHESLLGIVELLRCRVVTLTVDLVRLLHRRLLCIKYLLDARRARDSRSRARHVGTR